MKAVSKAQHRKRKSTKRGHEQLMGAIYEEAPQPQEDPRIVVLTARCVQMGKEPTEANRLAASWQIMGDPAGRAIAAEARDDMEAGKLWELFRRYDACHDAHHRRIIGRPRFPNVSKVEFLPETFEAREDEATDIRTQDEKDRDAANRWHRCMAVIYKLARHEREALMGALFLRVPLTKGATCTTAGRQFVMALRMVRDVEERG